MSKSMRSQGFLIAGIFILVIAFQNCDSGSSGVPEVTVDTSSNSQLPPGPLPAPPRPGPIPGPAPAPSPGPTPGIGANPMPLGLKATFRSGNILFIGAQPFPLDLNQPATQKIEVDIASNDSFYVSNPTYAIPNDDYVPFTGQTLTFNPGQTSANVTVQLLKVSGKYFSFTANNCKYGGVPFSCLYLF